MGSLGKLQRFFDQFEVIGLIAFFRRLEQILPRDEACAGGELLLIIYRPGLRGKRRRGLIAVGVAFTAGYGRMLAVRAAFWICGGIRESAKIPDGMRRTPLRLARLWGRIRPCVE